MVCFDERQAGRISAVHDNTRHRRHRRVAEIPDPVSPSAVIVIPPSEVVDTASIETSSGAEPASPVIVATLLNELRGETDPILNSGLSQKQIDEIIQLCVVDFTTNGCISFCLINLMSTASSKSPTSSTPDDRP